MANVATRLRFVARVKPSLVCFFIKFYLSLSENRNMYTDPPLLVVFTSHSLLGAVFRGNPSSHWNLDDEKWTQGDAQRVSDWLRWR